MMRHSMGVAMACAAGLFGALGLRVVLAECGNATLAIDDPAPTVTQFVYCEAGEVQWRCDHIDDIQPHSHCVAPPIVGLACQQDGYAQVISYVRACGTTPGTCFQSTHTNNSTHENYKQVPCFDE